MSLFQRYRWYAAGAGITLAFAVVSLIVPRGPALTAFADLGGLTLMLAATAILVANARTRPRQERSFWALMASGVFLWAANQASWCYYEIILHRPLPDPYVFDIVLFFHAVPIFAAVAWRPDLEKKEGKVFLSVLNFLMLAGWWMFLYAFIVFPHQYVVLDVHQYNVYYDRLYDSENGLVVMVLLLAAWTSSGAWRTIYRHLLCAFGLYAISSQLLNEATANTIYFSGSLYDVPLIGSVAWLAAAAMSARESELTTSKFNLDRRWKKLVPELAMLAILSLPVLGLWTVILDKSPAPSRAFRLFAVLGAMLLLGTFVFLRQYAQDQALMKLLRESRRAYESQKQLQTQLVQKEKLASLGNLVAGAAHDINHPLSSIMTQSEHLWSNENLTDHQNALLRKIVSQAGRTRDLVANLLSFAQQAPGEKTVVDVAVLLKRAIQMLESRRPPEKIHVNLAIDGNFPRVHANANQLFQTFVEIIENAMDALSDSGGGLLDITAQAKGREIELQFSDNGPGIRDPERVFDPFYTTKPVGKGTGLGLSAVYGVIQDHGGQITCRNKPEGGALFTVTLPAAADSAAQVAGAAG